MSEWTTRLSDEEPPHYYAIFEPTKDPNTNAVVVILLPQSVDEVWAECQMAVGLRCRMLLVTESDEELLKCTAEMVERLRLPDYQRLSLESVMADYERHVTRATEH